MPAAIPVNPGNITDRLDEDLLDNQYLNPNAWTQAAGVHVRQLRRAPTATCGRRSGRTGTSCSTSRSGRVARRRADVRIEILNFFNQPKYAGFSSSTFGNSGFGRVTTQAGFMRIWQLSFRFAF